MNIETTAGNLKSALALMSGVIERRNTIPVLGTVRIDGNKITGTNLNIEATTTIPTTGKAKGAVALDYDRLTALAKHVQPDEAVSIADLASLASIGFNGSRYTLPSIPASDFPEFGEVTGERSEIGNAGIVAAFKRVRFAISTEETRYYLNGIALLENADGSAVAAATDGHRLAILPIAFMPANGKNKIIHHALVDYLCARKSEPKAATFGTDKANARFEYDGLTVSAKLIDGTYPDIWRVIPKEPVRYFSCDRARMLVVLKRMAAFARTSEYERRGVKIAGSADKLTLTIGREGQDSAREEISGACSEPFEAGYNVHYLIDALSAHSGEIVSFASEKGMISGAPAVITSTNDQLRVVLMPMRV